MLDFCEQQTEVVFDCLIQNLCFSKPTLSHQFQSKSVFSLNPSGLKNHFAGIISLEKTISENNTSSSSSLQAIECVRVKSIT